MPRLNPIHTRLLLLAPAGALALTVAAPAEAATPTYYDSEAAFLADITKSVTDPYSNPGYGFIQNNAVMSAVLGETDYKSTGFDNLNIVSGGVYCAGCNGSFELSFQTTSVGTAEGVNGVGAKIQFNDPGQPYFAYITFADDTMANIQLPSAGSYWGVSSPERIRSIHFGLTMGGVTQGGSFGIDDLTVGDMMAGCKADAECPEDANPCTSATCTAGKCGFTDNTDPCDDGDLCTESDLCAGGVCAGSPKVCDDDNVCTDDSCDPKDGACVAAPNTAPCDDGDLCTESDVCAGGLCAGAALECNDDNVCTMDSCDPGVGCVNAPGDGCCLIDPDCGLDEICDLDSNTCVPAVSTTSDASTGSTGDGSSTSEGSSTGGTEPDPTSSTGGTGVGESASGTTGDATASATDTAPTGTDGGTAGGSSSTGDAVNPVAGDDGCGCTSDPRPQNGAWLLLAALGLLIRRRRAA